MINQPNYNKQDGRYQQRAEFRDEICCICSKRGHIGEQCRSQQKCTTCGMNGHSKEKCRNHLLCTRCNRKGHTVDRCFRKEIAPSYMALSNGCNIIKWIATIDNKQSEVALDSCAQTSVMSYSLAKSWNINILKSNDMIET